MNKITLEDIIQSLRRMSETWEEEDWKWLEDFHKEKVSNLEMKFVYVFDFFDIAKEKVFLCVERSKRFRRSKTRNTFRTVVSEDEKFCTVIAG